MTSLADHMTEAQLLEKVVALAKARGWMVYHTYDSRRSAAGFPDLVLARDGFVIMAELKTEVGRLSAVQDAWLTELNPYGGEAFRFHDTTTDADVRGPLAVEVWRPGDWADIERMLA